MKKIHPRTTLDSPRIPARLVTGACVTFTFPILVGCGVLHWKNPIPGESKVGSNPQGVPVSTILTATKLQIAGAIDEINQLKKAHPDSPITKLTLKDGTGLLTATVIDGTATNGSAGGVIPFSGYSDTSVGPTLEGGWSANSSREESFKFGIGTKITEDHGELMRSMNGVDAGRTIQKAIVNRYKDILQIPTNSGKPLGPALTPMSISMKFTFIVVKSASGKVDIAFVPDAAFKSVSGKLGGTMSNTQSHQISLELPFDSPDTGDKRELFYFVDGSDRKIVVKEPYSEARYNELLKGPKTPKSSGPNDKPKIFNENLPEFLKDSEDGLVPLKSPPPF